MGLAKTGIPGIERLEITLVASWLVIAQFPFI